MPPKNLHKTGNDKQPPPGDTIHSTPSPSPLSRSNAGVTEIHSEDIQAHMNEGDVIAFLNKMSLDDIEFLMKKSAPVQKALANAELAETAFRNTFLDANQRGEEYSPLQEKDPSFGDTSSAHSRFHDWRRKKGLEEPLPHNNNTQGFRPSTDNFLPRTSSSHFDHEHPAPFPPNPTDHNYADTISGTKERDNNDPLTNKNIANPPPWATSSNRNQGIPTTQPSSTNSACLSTGFALRAVGRPDGDTSYEADRVVISRFNRGTTEKERAKIRALCTTEITPKISRSSITKLLTSTNTGGTDEEYNIAEDASKWQVFLDTTWQHIVNNDFKHIFMVPSCFDPHNASSIASNAIFINAVLDHDKLTDQDIFNWQAFVRRFGRFEELTSDQWMEDKLWKSLSPDLLAEVRSDFRELPVIHKGAISLLRLIINRVVQSNQESRRAMETYIKTFNIQSIPGEDVTKANLRIKAIAQALGTTRLPSDIIHRVLEGFARASTPAFQNFCAYQESMFSSSIVRSNMNNHTLYNQLLMVLNDLEVKYTDLLSGHRWLGIGVGTSETKSVFVTNPNDSTDEYDSSSPSDDDDGYDDYAIYTMTAGKNMVPFDEWVRDKVCRNCNEIGHIERYCPHPSTRRHQHHARRSITPYQPPRYNTNRRYPPMHRKQHDTRNNNSFRHSNNTTMRRNDSPSMAKRSYVQQALVSSSTTRSSAAPSSNTPVTVSRDTNTGAPPTPPTTASPSDNERYSAFLAALGCPKE